jgi:hypothetical protein
MTLGPPGESCGSGPSAGQLQPWQTRRPLSKLMTHSPGQLLVPVWASPPSSSQAWIGLVWLITLDLSERFLLLNKTPKNGIMEYLIHLRNLATLA